MNKHTPGPWLRCKESPKIIVSSFLGEERYILGSVTGNDNSGYYADEAEADANANLIAAAPELLEALICAADALWEDSREVHMDSTMMFGHGYDWDGWNDFRWEMHAKCGSFAIWPTGYPRVWSAYGGNDGSYWNQCFSSEAGAKAAIAKYIASIEPDHPAAKAYAAIAKAKGEQA